MMPLPKEEATPPVTKMNFVLFVLATAMMLLSLLVYQINLFDDGRHFLLGALDLVVHVADHSLSLIHI